MKVIQVWWGNKNPVYNLTERTFRLQFLFIFLVDLYIFSI
jgi:hypothetical protein